MTDTAHDTGPTDTEPTLRLSLIVAPADVGSARWCEFGAEGGLIGRGDGCRWVLEDPSRTISRQHGRIEFRDGRFWLSEAGTNGIYLADTDVRIGRGRRMPVRDGMVFRFGVHGVYVFGAELSGVTDPGGDAEAEMFADPGTESERRAPVAAAPRPTPAGADATEGEHVAGTDDRDPGVVVIRALLEELRRLDAARASLCSQLGVNARALPDDAGRPGLLAVRTRGDVQALLADGEADAGASVLRAIRALGNGLIDHEVAMLDAIRAGVREASAIAAVGLDGDGDSGAEEAALARFEGGFVRAYEGSVQRAQQRRERVGSG